jgi:uncharacterized protein (TIGR03435 family)
MKHKLITFLCIIGTMAAVASAQTAPASNEAQRLAKQISDFAIAQCGGKDAGAAPDCHITALWAATQCPDRVTAAPADTTATSAHCPATEQGFEYEVSSIKPHKDDGNIGSPVSPTADGYRAISVTMRKTVLYAYSAGLQLEITGEPAWMNQTRFDIEAKFAPEVAEALKKLTPDDRSFVQRYMIQQVLKERMNFAAHLDTKEVPAYDLVVGKNGPKLKAADPDAKDNGSTSMQPDLVKIVLIGKGVPMVTLARNLSGAAGRPVFDKTGLAGIYDFTLAIARDQDLSASVPGEGAAGTAAARISDPSGRTVTAALEEQLGLKLVSSRGPMQVVVIEHMDKPGAN